MESHDIDTMTEGNSFRFNIKHILLIVILTIIIISSFLYINRADTTLPPKTALPYSFGAALHQ